MTATLEQLPIPITPSLTAEQAEEIYHQGKEAVIFVILQLAKMAGEQQAQAASAQGKPTPTTPSGMIPPYQKPSAKTRRKKPGRKNGHAGSRRPKPTRIHHRKDHRAESCPDCGGTLNRRRQTRVRYVEDIPEIEPEVTEHTIHRDWCPQCRKTIEPKVTEALPGSMLGNRIVVLTAWLHYALGNTLSQIIEVFNFHLQLLVSAAGLLKMWYRLQAILFPWYQQIQEEALNAAVLHADETGWRVDGKTHWLWCFSTPTLTYFMIDRSRGSPALLQFFTEEFGGVLVSDFWGAYNAVHCALRQTCLVHLLRELETVEKYKSPGEDWRPFAKKLRRLLGDAIRLWRQREELSADKFASLRGRLTVRLDELIAALWSDKQVLRLIKRLKRHRNDLFTFVDQPGVPFHNNHAEQEIRPAVILRKNSYGNRSDRGADCQAVLMSIFRTLKQRSHNPIQTICSALSTYLQTGKLPPLPEQIAAHE